MHGVSSIVQIELRLGKMSGYIHILSLDNGPTELKLLETLLIKFFRSNYKLSIKQKKSSRAIRNPQRLDDTKNSLDPILMH